MKINKTEYYTEIETDDFTFLIQKDGSQISIEKDEGESLYIDLDIHELAAIYQAIKEALTDN